MIEVTLIPKGAYGRLFFSSKAFYLVPGGAPRHDGMVADKPDVSDERCASCAAFERESARLEHLGFGRCAHLPPWRELNAAARCTFVPTRWSAELVRTPL